MDAAQTKYIGFWQRFIAFVIDSLFASLLLLPITMNMAAIDISILSDPIQSQIYLQSVMLGLSFKMLLIGVIFVLFWFYFSATPGKLLFKSYIVDAATHKAATKLQLTIRYFGYFISLMPLGLGFLWIAFDEKKQSWHDKIAGTVVINHKPLI